MPPAWLTPRRTPWRPSSWSFTLTTGLSRCREDHTAAQVAIRVLKARMYDNLVRIMENFKNKVSIVLRTADCGLRTADCGLRTVDCEL
jgi:hypothetical protein